MTSATDELRRMLDERGVEHDDLGGKTYWEDERGMPFIAATIIGDAAHVNVKQTLTPEQAVEATLGRGTCHVAAFGFCSECGARMDGIYQHYCPNCGRHCVG